MCGLTDWPDEVCEMYWLEELNFRNYTYDDKAWDFENFQKGKWIQRNDEYRLKTTLIRNQIKKLPSAHELKKMQNLKKLSIGGGYNFILGIWELWELVEIESILALKELKHLECVHTPVLNFQVLTNLTSLHTLKLTDTSINELNSIASLRKLELLDISDTLVSDFQPLSDLSALQSLNLRGTEVSDLTFLSGLTSTISLNLSNTGISSLKFLNDLSALQSLNLSNTYISNLSPVTHLSTIRALNVRNTGIIDLHQLSGFSTLRSLNLFDTEISDLEPLSHLSTLRSLNLRNTKVSDLQSLSSLQSLESLNLRGTKVSDLRPLSSLLAMLALNLRDNVITDLQSISHLSALQSLDLQGTLISDLQLVSGLSALQSLNLQGTMVSDLQPLSSLSALKLLNLRGTTVSDLRPLSALSALQSLNLLGTKASQLRPLSGLSVLQSLNLRGTKVSDLQPLSGLMELQLLNLRGTAVSDLEPLSSILSLRSLNVYRTRVTNVRHLSNLSTLQTLNLGKTRVSDLQPLSDLYGLQSLNIYISQVSDISSLFNLLHLPHMQVSLEHEPNGIMLSKEKTEVPPPEVIERGIKQVILYFEQQRATGAELVPNQEVKLVLLGNSTAGKTSLLTYLSTSAERRSAQIYKSIYTTHGIQEKIWKPKDLMLHREGEILENLEIKVLDFGGQEYYHDCHHLFFTNRTAYLVLWERDTNLHIKALTNQKKKSGPVSEEIEHFGLEYWLEAIGFLVRKRIPEQNAVESFPQFKGLGKEEDQRLGKEGAKKFLFNEINALVIQNKVSKDGRVFLNQKKLSEQFPFIQDFAEVDVHKNIAMHHLEHFQLKNLLETMSILGERVLDFYPKVDKVLANDQNVVITRKSFDVIFSEIVTAETRIKKGDNRLSNWAKLYLDYRFDTGKLLYYPDSKNEALKDQVITKPYDMINRFYAILNRKLEDKRGEFSRKDAQKALKMHLKVGRLEEVGDDTDFMLSLMQHFHIIFPLPHDQDVFVAPQYLPKTPHKSTSFLKKLLRLATHKYAYSGFFHKSVVQAFFHQYGQHAQTSQEKPVDADDYFFWRNGIIIKTPEHSQIVMVEFSPKEHATYIRPQDGDPNGPLVKEIMDCFTEIHKGRTVEQEVSVNGRDFVRLDKLVDCATKGLPMLEANETLHRVADFSNFLPDNLKKNFMRKKLFISYSKHDMALVEELKAHLSPLKRNGEIETWYDHDIQAGANFNTEIENNLRSADIILLMISADFINTDYVWNKEIPLAFELEKTHPDKTVVPIILRHCDWTSLHHDLIEKNSPAKGKPIKSYADRDEGWTVVVKALKEVVRGKPVPQEPEKGEK